MSSGRSLPLRSSFITDDRFSGGALIVALPIGEPFYSESVGTVLGHTLPAKPTEPADSPPFRYDHFYRADS